MIPVRADVRLCVATPVYGGYHPHFVPCLIDLLHNSPPCEKIKHLSVVGDSLVSRARNRAVAAFLKSDFTHLLFIDTDLIFSPDHVARLLSHDLPIVAGFYPKKQTKLAWVCNTIPGEEMDPATKLQKVRYIGTGFLLIAREVLERFMEAFPEREYQPDAGEPTDRRYFDFFPVGPWTDPTTGHRRYLSEDWYFCQLCRDLGYDIYGDCGVALKHCGDAIFPLVDPSPQADPAAAPTEPEPAAAP